MLFATHDTPSAQNNANCGQCDHGRGAGPCRPGGQVSDSFARTTSEEMPIRSNSNSRDGSTKTLDDFLWPFRLQDCESDWFQASSTACSARCKSPWEIRAISVQSQLHVGRSPHSIVPRRTAAQPHCPTRISPWFAVDCIIDVVRCCCLWARNCL